MGSDSNSMITPSSKSDHVVIFPFPSKGHIIPLLHLSTNLSSKGIRVTLITTQSNSSFFHAFLSLPRPNIHLKLIPFPDSTTTSLPPGVESTDQLPSFHLFPSFLFATTLLDGPFRRAITSMVEEDGDVPLCVISDFFCGWTVGICREFGIPRLVFHGLGVFSMSLSKSLVLNQTHVDFAGGDEEFHVPGTPETLRLTYSDVPEMLQQMKDDPVIQFVVKNEKDELNSWGVVVNSFADVEGDYVAHFESFYDNANAWLVGPLCLHSPPSDGSHSSDLIEWLGTKGESSVVYVSFGTMVFWPEEQLEEIWYGLEMSGYDYFWVVRSPTWEPPVKGSRRGFVYKDWAPQREVLRHRSVGGFLSHCGWNSVLESVTAEVPILAWPVLAEQSLNAKFVVDVLGVGIRLTVAGGGGRVVGREMICDGVRELMGGENGKRVRAKVAEKGRAAEVAVEEGGSSYNTVYKLFKELREVKQNVQKLI